MEFEASGRYRNRKGERRHYVGACPESMLRKLQFRLVFCDDDGRIGRYTEDGRFYSNIESEEDIIGPWIDIPTEVLDPATSPPKLLEQYKRAAAADVKVEYRSKTRGDAWLTTERPSWDGNCVFRPAGSNLEWTPNPAAPTEIYYGRDGKTPLQEQYLAWQAAGGQIEMMELSSLGDKWSSPLNGLNFLANYIAYRPTGSDLQIPQPEQEPEQPLTREEVTRMITDRVMAVVESVLRDVRKDGVA